MIFKYHTICHHFYIIKFWTRLNNDKILIVTISKKKKF